jgi:hypothetical protein
MHARYRGPWRFGLLVTLGLLTLSATPSAAAPPGGATPLGPSSLITGTTHTFTWQAGSNATF